MEHLLVGLDAAGDTGSPSELPPALPATSQVIVHRLQNEPAAGSSLESGVYRLAESGPEYLRPGAWLTDMSSAGDEALLLVRVAGEPVTPGKEFARIYVHGADGERTRGLRRLVAELRTAT
jgi:hypothetical protein